jgi:hypothetical protein
MPFQPFVETDPIHAIHLAPTYFAYCNEIQEWSNSSLG